MQADNLTTVRALMRRLWQLYDSGGHSGRSVRSQLLEAAFWPQPEDLPEVDSSYEGLKKLEVNAAPTGYIHLFSIHLERTNTEMYFCLVLREMQKTKPGEPEPSCTEQHIISCALALLRSKERFAQYEYCGGKEHTAEALIAEGQRRNDPNKPPITHWHLVL